MSTESILEQYRIHDFIRWYDSKELIINPSFQRRSVWDPQARTLLVDTILRRMPMPKIYMRTKLDTRTKRSVREVVDGQQRLRAIIDFAAGKFALSRRAGEYAGLRYDDLNENQQADFLSYAISVDSLLNATDSDVLEVFSRLNSYTVKLVPAELRHAKYQGDFKWAVHQSALHWKILWEKFEIVTGRDRLRMGDDELMAEMMGILLEGVTDGGAARINRAYEKYDDGFDESRIRYELEETLNFITVHFEGALDGTPIKRPTQFLMLFAATASALNGIPQGQLPESIEHAPAHIDRELALGRLMILAGAIEQGQKSGPYARLVDASTGSTQRIATRSVRYEYYRWAITGQGKIEAQ